MELKFRSFYEFERFSVSIRNFQFRANVSILIRNFQYRSKISIIESKKSVIQRFDPNFSVSIQNFYKGNELIFWHSEKSDWWGLNVNGIFLPKTDISHLIRILRVKLRVKSQIWQIYLFLNSVGQIAHLPFNRFQITW